MNNLEEGDHCCFTTISERKDVILRLRSLGIIVGVITWDKHDSLEDFEAYPILKYTADDRFIVSVPTFCSELRNEYSVTEFMKKAGSPKKPKGRYEGHSIKHYFL